MVNWVYKGCCYATDANAPFGFCHRCWVENGSPKPVGE